MGSTKYDFLIVGSGFFGSVCARELTDKGKTVCVIDKRDHIGGNCYTSERDGIHVHDYGPHIFHTSNDEVWEWINRYTKFNSFTLSPVANYKGEIYSLPFNMWTFSKIFKVAFPEEVKLKIHGESMDIQNPSNFEDQAIKLVGKTVYEKLIKGYTEKQWRKPAIELPKEIIERLPVRFTYNNNYFNDKYQGIPVGGYTQIFEKLLEGIDLLLGVDFFKDELPDYEKLIYTGPIDRYFNYRFGELEYKSTQFNHQRLDIDNFQGCAVMNYTDKETEYTRTIEHKYFDFIESDKTWVTWEYPIKYDPNTTDPYYPVNDEINNNIYYQYKSLADKESDVYFGGRLGEYKYYDMDDIIESALSFIKKTLLI